MAINETSFKPGDTDNNLLRKILMVLLAQGTGSGPTGNVNVTGGALTSAGAVTIADGADVALGSTTDPAKDGSTSGTVVSFLRGTDVATQNLVVATGSPTDAVVTNPVLSASVIAALKGILTADNLTNTNVGAAADAAVTNPASSASVIASLKGILTADNLTNTNVGAVADAAVTNPASSASVIASLKGNLTASNTTNTNLGAVADAAVTNPASSASVIAALKGILTGVNLNQNVGGYTSVIKDTTAVSTTPAYTAGDAVGGKRTITNALRTSGGSGILESVQILDRANQKAAMELFIFDSDPSAATITDNAAFVFSTDDLKVLAHVTIAATDYVTINSKAVATIKGLGVALKGNATSTLYAALVTTGTPTYAATTDLQLIYGILQD